MISCICHIWLIGCKRDISLPQKANPPQKKVVFILVDGPRWTETGGDPSQSLIPCMRDSLQLFGTTFNNFYNDSFTSTNPGHCAFFSGNYENIANDGSQKMSNPSLTQLFIEKYPNSINKTWLVTTKDKLEVLKDCLHPDFAGKNMCKTDCGVSGLGSGYREDSITFKNAKNIIKTEKPDFLFVAFKQPDAAGHSGVWADYTAGITQSYQYAWELFKLLQQDSTYLNNTYFIISNDHGRHLDGWSSGFVSHGDTCLGCRHINLYIQGPGIKKNFITNDKYGQIDLNKTICRWLGLKENYSTGKFIEGITE